MYYPDPIGTLQYPWAVAAVIIPVEIMYPEHPMPADNVVVPYIHDDSRAENIPTALYPGIPPGGIILPAIRGDIHLPITPAQYVLHYRPVVHIDKISVVRMVSAPVIGVAFNRLHNDLLAVKVFVPHDLQNGLAPAGDFQFDNGHVLYIATAQRSL